MTPKNTRELLSKIYTRTMTIHMSAADVKANGIIPLSKTVVNYNNETMYLIIESVKTAKGGGFNVKFGIPKQHEALYDAWDADLKNERKNDDA